MAQRQGCCSSYKPNPEGNCINALCPTIMQGRANRIGNYFEVIPQNDRCPGYSSDVLGQMVKIR
jgi:hypothetical protein